ncbi:MAG: ArdC-like ssDNA-binding domain-containing protein [Phycisphaerae bacterium]|nr:ArdC-like ssDNA-binding domain-containing protein [Phycisphaerae bacterium]
MKTERVRKQIDDALEELGKQLEQGASEQMLAYLSAMARFHNYSWGNIMLIQLGRPEASKVAGYQTWRRLGRQVKKGEHGIAIMAPMVRRRREDEDEEEDKVFAFKTAYVFDVSQTEGKPLPEATQTRGEPGEWITRLKAFLASQGIQLLHLGSMSRAEGASFGGAVAVRPGLAAAEEFSVLCHEAAHEWMHREDRGKDSSKTVRETEAEAVAFVVCQAVGLDTNTASSDYIGLYSGNKEVLAKSLGRIRRTAARIIEGLTASPDSKEQTVTDHAEGVAGQGDAAPVREAA